MKTTSHCRICGCAFEQEAIEFNGRIFAPSVCDPCTAARDRELAAIRAADHQRQLAKSWACICPPEYAATNRDRLPHPELLDQVLAWRFGPTGLLLHGETGTGKSRCAYALLRREHFDGRRVRAVSGFAMSAYPAKLMADSRKAADWLAECVRADVLLLDDVAKVKLSERVEEALFLIVEERTAHRRPIIATTNDDGASLAARLGDDRAEPLIRRLREFCQTIACRAPYA